MEKTISVADLHLGQKVNQIAFALKELEQKVSRNGKPYYNVVVGDKTGDIRGKVWTEKMTNVDTGLNVGDIVLISGEIQEYAGKPQIVIEEIRATDGMAPEEFLPVTGRDRKEMTEVLTDEIQKTENPYIRKILDIFWSDTNNRDRFINFPAAEYVHHGYVGGMIEHVYEMNELSRPFLRLYPQLDRDLLFFGIFFHDIGKLDELDIVGASIIRTNAGKLVAHIGQGLLLVSKLVDQIEDFPEELKEKVFHMILSHQGSLEFGSPIKPQMLESMVLSMIDANSADMNQATKLIENSLYTGEDFSEYQRWLGRSLYQKDYLPDEE